MEGRRFESYWERHERKNMTNDDVLNICIDGIVSTYMLSGHIERLAWSITTRNNDFICIRSEEPNETTLYALMMSFMFKLNLYPGVVLKSVDNDWYIECELQKMNFSFNDFKERFNIRV